jgi:deoxyuridine 5'-triphosphate nucleotidohydrolase
VPIYADPGQQGTIPTRATEDSAGLDLYTPKPGSWGLDAFVTCVGYEDENSAKEMLVQYYDRDAKLLMVEPGYTWIIDTGVKIQLPHGFEGQIRSRSGLGSQGLVVAQGVGTIDSDYRGNIKVALRNQGLASVAIGMGQRIAQLIIAEIITLNFEERAIDRKSVV